MTSIMELFSIPDIAKPYLRVLLIFSVCISNSCRQEEAPVVTTHGITDITWTSAISGGVIVDEGSSPIISKGVTWSTDINPTLSDEKTNDGLGEGEYLSIINGLQGATIYHVRAYATSTEGTGYGEDLSFVTLPYEAPEVVIDEIESITDNTARCSFRILSDGGSHVLTSGLVWSTDSSSLLISAGHPTQNAWFNNEGYTTLGKTYKSTAVKLTPWTEYYIKAYAFNLYGTGYSKTFKIVTIPHLTSDIEFNPNVIYGNLTDQDGNTYKTVRIGNREWMAENLKTVTYSDGSTVYESDVDYIVTPIPMMYHWYDNNIENKANYGALYSWYAIKNGKLCPTGWHVPSAEEWYEMILTLDSGAIDPMQRSDTKIYSTFAGGMIKEAGFKHWNQSNLITSNTSGFTALPGGYCIYYPVQYELLGIQSFFWTSSEIVTLPRGQTLGMNFHFRIGLDYNTNSISLYIGDQNSSVRCVRSFN